MDISVATITIIGSSPYSQSRGHNEPKLQGENHDDYDERTWRSKMTVEEYKGKKTVVIPAHGFMQCLASGAKYSKRQIPGQGKATWTQKFLSGITLMENPRLNVDPDSVNCITISANADGVRGSGKRVPRRFPQIPAGWQSRFDVQILDPIITKQVFSEMVQLAGMFIGIGQFRPEKGGLNGRFQLSKLEWEDNRKFLT